MISKKMKLFYGVFNAVNIMFIILIAISVLYSIAYFIKSNTTRNNKRILFLASMIQQTSFLLLVKASFTYHVTMHEYPKYIKTIDIVVNQQLIILGFLISMIGFYVITYIIRNQEISFFDYNKKRKGYRRIR